jgi:hypothetical protein
MNLHVVRYPIVLYPSWRLLWAVLRAFATRKVVAFTYPVVLGNEDESAPEARTLQ